MSYASYSANQSNDPGTGTPARTGMVKSLIVPAMFVAIVGMSGTGNASNNIEHLTTRGTGTDITAIKRDKSKDTLSQWSNEGDDNDEGLLGIDDMASATKSMLGINVSDLAKILGVSRPTAYKYIDGNGPTEEPMLGRLEITYQLAHLWFKKAGDKPIGRELKRAYDGHSLLELFAQEVMDYDAIQDRLSFLAEISNERASRVERTSALTAHSDSKQQVRNISGQVS